MVVSVGVDSGDHDEVHCELGLGVRGHAAPDLLIEAIAALTAMRDTLLSLKQMASKTG